MVGSPVSVIIAALNEERFIGASVASALAAGAAEVIVADGGSSDRTRELAEAAGARVLTCTRMRSKQFNAAANAATGTRLIFLHADTTLPAGAAGAVDDALANGMVFGGFRLQFAEPGIRLRLAERLINLRTRLTRCPWGDQAQFVDRETFLTSGGFREIPIMEDYAMAIAMKHRGRTTVLPLTVITSGRRFLKKGSIATIATNWRIIIAFRNGADPERLARIYRGE
jgi:rSAM/selenodomain-associated transferase 2